MLLTINLWMLQRGNVDFPCEWFGSPPALAQVETATRIAYCLSWYPRDYYGAAPFGYGSATTNQIVVIQLGSTKDYAAAFAGSVRAIRPIRAASILIR